MLTSVSTPIARIRRLNLAIALSVAIAAFACLGTWTATASATGNDVVVFDIDGTLTNDGISLTPHAGAVNAVKTYMAKGYNVVYLTGRPIAMDPITRSWLLLNGFPSRPLYQAAIPYLTDSSLIDYKTRMLRIIEDGSREVRYAYGDSSTDFVAYANAGVPAANVWAVKKVSDSGCESGTWTACLPNYTGHLSYINSLPPGS